MAERATSSFWQWMIPLAILCGFICVSGWSVVSMRLAAEERFRFEAISNCKVLEVAITGETTRDEGVPGFQIQINALAAKDRHIIRLSYVGRDQNGTYRHLASNIPERIGTPAQEEDLAVLASGQLSILEVPHGKYGALDISFPVHDPHNKFSGIICYTVVREAPPRGPMELALVALLVIVALLGYFFVQLRAGRREMAQRRQIEKILQQNDRMKNEFISTAAHELRTPLTSVIGYTDILLDPELSAGFSEAQRRDFLCEIADKSDALAKIVDNLLDISRIQSGRDIPLEREICNLAELLSKEVGHFRLKSPRHHFDLDLQGATTATAWVDRHKIMQVLENILGNAIKFSPNGGMIAISAAVIDSAYKIQISDQGIGMTAEQCARIFEKFYRADNSNVAIGGLGLGMSIVHKIVAAHDGTISVESTPGVGTTIAFTLPLQVEGQENAHTLHS